MHQVVRRENPDLRRRAAVDVDFPGFSLPGSDSTSALIKCAGNLSFLLASIADTGGRRRKGFAWLNGWELFWHWSVRGGHCLDALGA